MFSHPNVLPVLEYWIQCTNLTTISLVIATPLCQKNLRQWVETELFDFSKIRYFLIGALDGLSHIASRNVSHGDVKLENILVDKSGKAVISDFGIDGITPVYAAPESLRKNGNVVGKTDVYGFGVVILLTFFDNISGLNLLYNPGLGSKRTPKICLFHGTVFSYNFLRFFSKFRKKKR